MNPRFHQPRPRRRNLSVGGLILLLVLLFFPGWMILRLVGAFDPRLMGGYFAFVSGLTFWLYWHDKRRAVAGGWRTPESTLHLAEFFGGWPAAFLAQRILRHKIAKTRYQIAFWTIVLFHEAVSFDFLCHWHYAQAAIGLLRP